MSLSAFIFDIDGTLVDSNEKQEARRLELGVGAGEGGFSKLQARSLGV
jgi:FMN phosphatase YigB (HAD superfamily)